MRRWRSMLALPVGSSHWRSPLALPFGAARWRSPLLWHASSGTSRFSRKLSPALSLSEQRLPSHTGPAVPETWSWMERGNKEGWARGRNLWRKMLSHSRRIKGQKEKENRLLRRASGWRRATWFSGGYASLCQQPSDLSSLWLDRLPVKPLNRDLYLRTLTC